MKKQFINLNLFTVYFPFTAIISFLHRASGIFIFLLIPLLLWLIESALSSANNFAYIHTLLIHPIMRLLLWGLLAAFGYHFLAGIRHIIMDMGFGEDLPSARFSGAIILLLSILWAIFVGVWLW